MLRSSLLTASAFALVAGASAQTPQQLRAEAIPGAVKDAGIYHVATGTWTRTGGAVANFGPDTIYSNTAGTGYFNGAGGAGGFAAGSDNIDEGGLPGTTNLNPFLGGTGPDRDEYQVNGFQIGYCDNGAPGTGGWDLAFYSSHDPCDVPITTPARTLSVGPIPAGGCWLVTIDLMGSPDEFCLEADGGPVAPDWDDDPDFDSFGFQYTYSGTDGTQLAGFLLRGDPKYTDPTWVNGAVPTDGTGTYYGPASLCAGGNTGYLTQDFWRLTDPLTPANDGCYFFGGYINRNGCGGPQGNPYASFYLELYADSGPCGDPIIGSIYCTSNPNSTGVNTTMETIGSDVAANDDVLLRAGEMPPNAFGFFITSQTQGFTANPGGSQGNICLAGNIGRFVAPGQVKNSLLTGEITLDTNIAEWTLQAIPTATGPYAAMTGITTNFQAWHRDVVGGMAVSNFSDGRTVTWQ